MAKTSWGLAALAAAGLALSGCSDDGDTFLIGGGGTTIPTRADSIAGSIEDSWTDNNSSINVPADNLETARVFQCCDGSGLVAFYQDDDATTGSLFFAYFDSSGGILGLAEARGDFVDEGPSAAAFDMVVLWTPNGDAVITFKSLQATDVTSTTDVESLRVYYGTFRRSLARQANGPNGEVFGFSSFEPVDTNTDGTDDNAVSTLFALSNGIDGAVTFNPSFPELTRSGFRGDNAANLTPVIFLGWIYEDSNTDRRVEGYFVDLQDGDNDGDTLDLTSTSPTQISFNGIGTGESVSPTMWASGAEGVFLGTDSDGNGQDRMYLVRVDPTGPSLETPIEISRGTNTNSLVSTMRGVTVIGDGYRAYNGQDTTWVIWEDDNYTDGTVTQADEDLLIAQVDGSGTVELGEFDHEGVASVDTNDLGDLRVQIKRGATRAFVYYTQDFDADVMAEQNNTALFVRALRLNGGEALADNVSAEATINGAQNSDGFSDPDTDTNLVQFSLADLDPLCDADVNNDASYVAFSQQLDNDTGGDGDDSLAVRARLVTIDDITANPITVTLGAEETVFSSVDTGWVLQFETFPGSASTGEGLVYLMANGNNLSDDGVTGSFQEPRQFLYAAELPNGQSITTPLQIGSDSATGPGLSFPNARLVLSSSSGLEPLGAVTPNGAAQRDFAFDDDELAPRFFHAVFPEFTTTTDRGESLYRGRRFDLQSNASFGAASDRFSPALTEFPDVVGPVGGNLLTVAFPRIDLLPAGDDVVAVFNTIRFTTPGSNGQVFVNTSNDGSWSDAALLSNDRDQEILPNSIGFLDNPSGYWTVLPGLTSDCCPTAAGSFVFWIRFDFSGFISPRFTLQGRRITGTTLPGE